jgi:predicted transcriptional regulator
MSIQKAILASVRPEYAQDILNKVKFSELRKNLPNLEALKIPPYQFIWVYMYVTKAESILLGHGKFINGKPIYTAKETIYRVAKTEPRSRGSISMRRMRRHRRGYWFNRRRRA